ncbi:choice-of-anchor J domain-containing protein [bacterium]|nr:choice-of-anchor J domain-containing protein [bacterium]
MQIKIKIVPILYTLCFLTGILFFSSIAQTGHSEIRPGDPDERIAKSPDNIPVSRWMDISTPGKPLHDVPAYDRVLTIIDRTPEYLYPKGYFPDSGRIAIIVHTDIYGSLDDELETLAVDLLLEDFSTIIYEYSSGSAEALRDSLIAWFNHDDSLTGAIFIGDIPYVIFEMMQEWDNNPGVFEYDDFPCDIFFMDMDGTWEDTLENEMVHADNGKYDTWNDDSMFIEIWVSRIRTDNLTELTGTQLSRIQNYLARNRAYRHGTFGLDRTASLVYNDDEWAYMTDSDQRHLELGFGLGTVITVDEPETTTAEHYRTTHLPEPYHHLLTRSHGSATSHGYYENDRTDLNFVTSATYREVDPPTLFYSFYVCAAADYTYDNYLCGTAVFNPEASGLLAWSSTKMGGIWNEELFYREFGKPRNKCFGNAFVTWFSEKGASNPRYYYGLTLIGDASLHVMHPEYIPDLHYISFTLDDTSADGDDDGFADPGESILMRLNINNEGALLNASNISLNLSSNIPAYITIDESTATVPNLAPGASAETNSPHFKWHSDGATPPTIITFTINWECNNGDHTGSFEFFVPIGATFDLPYSCDFESGCEDLWLSESLFGHNLWHLEDHRYSSGSYSCAYNSGTPDYDYNTGSRTSGSIYSPFFKLPAGSTPHFEFDQWIEVQEPDIETATVLLSEGFEAEWGNFPPPGWVILNWQWEQIAWRHGSHEHSGDMSAFADYSWYDSTDNDWLVTPPIDCSAYINLSLSFWDKVEYWGAYGPPYFRVLVSNTGLEMNDFDTLWTYYQTDPERNFDSLITIDLTEYDHSATLYIAWVFTGKFPKRWYIDDVTVTGTPIASDDCYLEISEDFGVNWSSLKRFSSSTTGWISPGLIDLRDYTDNIIRLRYRFDSHDALDNSYEGWYIDDFSIDSTDFPHLVYCKYIINDSEGDNDGFPEPGEAIVMPVIAKNNGTTDAINPTATIYTDDPFITITDNSASFPTIAQGDSAQTNADHFGYTIASNTPCGHNVIFSVGWTASDVNGSFQFKVPVTAPAPELRMSGYTLTDAPPGGDGDGYIENGETITLSVELENFSNNEAMAINGTISGSSPYISLINAEAHWLDINAHTFRETEAPHFSFSITSEPPGGVADVSIILEWQSFCHSGTDTINFTIGGFKTFPYFCDFEGGTHELWSTEALSGTVLWHLEDHRSSSPEHSYAYNRGAPDYNYNTGSRTGGALYSPYIKLPIATSLELTFENYRELQDTLDRVYHVDENFESFPSEPGWVIYDEDGDDKIWTIADTSDNYVDSTMVHSGIFVARVIHNFSVTNDDWLVTPQVTLNTDRGILSLWARSYSCNLIYLESFSIRVSTTGNEVENFTDTLAREIDVPCTWTRYAYSLSDYEGEDIYVAIIYDGDDNTIFYIDDVQLFEHPLRDDCYVHISTDYGSNWKELVHYSSGTTDWQSSGVVDIKPYEDNIVQFRFIFDSNDGDDNVYEGWYIDDVNLGSYPDLAYAGQHIQGGDGDGYAEAGETALIAINLTNIGGMVAVTPWAKLHTADSFLTVIDDSAGWLNIAPYESLASNLNHFSFSIPDTTPCGYVATFTLVWTSEGITDSFNFEVNIAAPEPDLLIGGYICLDDSPGGDGDGCLEEGETIILKVILDDIGGSGANLINAILWEEDPYITVLDSIGTWPTIEAFGSAECQPPYFTVLIDSVPGDNIGGAGLYLDWEAFCCDYDDDGFVIPLGVPESFPYHCSFDDGCQSGWNHLPIAGENLWHVQDNRYSTPDSSFAYNRGGPYDYNTGARTSGALYSPYIKLPEGSPASLTFKQWIQTQPPTPGVIEIINEGFEDDFPPDGWTIIDHNGLDVIWQQCPDSTDSVHSVHTGSHSALALHGGFIFINEELLVTPLINCSGIINLELTFYDDVLRWDRCGVNPNTVKVSTTTLDYNSFTTVWTYYCSDPDRDFETQVSIDLSAYDGSPVLYIAWDYKSYNGEDWNIDDVVLTGLDTLTDDCIVEITDDFWNSCEELAVFETTMASWNAVSPICLDDYTGYVVGVRFRFDSYNETDNAYEGWYVDDFQIGSNIVEVTIMLDSAYWEYNFGFEVDGEVYDSTQTFNWLPGSAHNLEFFGKDYAGVRTQSDGVFTPYYYLGHFYKWSDGTADHFDPVYNITAPAAPTTYTCYLLGIEAGPEIRLFQGQFFNEDGQKQPFFIGK